MRIHKGWEDRETWWWWGRGSLVLSHLVAEHARLAVVKLHDDDGDSIVSLEKLIYAFDTCTKYQIR